MDLTRVIECSEQHKFPLNVEICSHISMSNSMHHFSFYGTLVGNIHIQKDLEVYVTGDPKWGIHIKSPRTKRLEFFSC